MLDLKWSTHLIEKKNQWALQKKVSKQPSKNTPGMTRLGQWESDTMWDNKWDSREADGDGKIKIVREQETQHGEFYQLTESKQDSKMFEC